MPLYGGGTEIRVFKNILIGQYIDTGSVLHRLDARIKIIITLAFAVMIFSANGVFGVVYTIAVCFGLVLLSKMKASVILRSIKPIIFFAVFTLVFDSFLTEGRTLASFGIFKITYEGIYDGITAAVRLVLLVVTASILTLTTKPLEMTDAIESLLSPLAVFKVPVRDIAMMMGITIRFIPTIAGEAKRIADAQKSRCADFGGKGIIKRAYAALPLVVPLIAGAFRHSEALAQAMDARCYGAPVKRTHLHSRSIGRTDVYAAVCAAVIILIPIGVSFI